MIVDKSKCLKRTSAPSCEGIAFMSCQKQRAMANDEDEYFSKMNQNYLNDAVTLILGTCLILHGTGADISLDLGAQI